MNFEFLMVGVEYTSNQRYKLIIVTIMVFMVQTKVLRMFSQGGKKVRAYGE